MTWRSLIFTHFFSWQLFFISSGSKVMIAQSWPFKIFSTEWLEFSRSVRIIMDGTVRGSCHSKLIERFSGILQQNFFPFSVSKQLKFIFQIKKKTASNGLKKGRSHQVLVSKKGRSLENLFYSISFRCRILTNKLNDYDQIWKTKFEAVKNF